MTTTETLDLDTDIVDAATTAWPLLTPVIVVHEGGEITHPSTDALIGYERDCTTYGYVVGHKIRNVNWSDRAQRFIVIRQSDGTDWYHEIDVAPNGEITAYMASFERDGVTEAFPSDPLAAYESNPEHFGDLANDLVADGSIWPL
jgi:hypothetical protein